MSDTHFSNQGCTAEEIKIERICTIERMFNLSDHIYRTKLSLTSTIDTDGKYKKILYQFLREKNSFEK